MNKTHNQIILAAIFHIGRANNIDELHASLDSYLIVCQQSEFIPSLGVLKVYLYKLRNFIPSDLFNLENYETTRG